MTDLRTNAGRRLGAGPLAALVLAALLAAAPGCGASGAGRPVATPVAPGTAAPASGGLAGMRAPVVARVEPRQRDGFALLRSHPEGLPPRTRRLLGRPLFGMSWRLAQRIPVALPGRYWLVPARRHLCVVEEGSLGSPGAGSTCATTADALAHGLADITVKRRGSAGAGAPVGPARLIVGVAPGGARAVRVHTRGRVRTVPVENGTFVLRDALVAPPDRFELRRR